MILTSKSDYKDKHTEEKDNLAECKSALQLTRLFWIMIKQRASENEGVKTNNNNWRLNCWNFCFSLQI